MESPLLIEVVGTNLFLATVELLFPSPAGHRPGAILGSQRLHKSLLHDVLCGQLPIWIVDSSRSTREFLALGY